MSYASQDDMIARYGEDELVQLTDRSGAGSIDAAVLAQALADAAAVIDGHLAGRYPLPLSPVPAILVGYACDLARERLYKDAAPQIVLKRADDARRFLELLGQGRVGLGVRPEPEGASGVAWSAPARVMDKPPI